MRDYNYIPWFFCISRNVLFFWDNSFTMMCVCVFFLVRLSVNEFLIRNRSRPRSPRTSVVQVSRWEMWKKHSNDNRAQNRFLLHCKDLSILLAYPTVHWPQRFSQLAHIIVHEAHTTTVAIQKQSFNGTSWFFFTFFFLLQSNVNNKM